jgi:hypothetical protein
MPTSLEAFVLLLLAILPGFIAVSVDRHFRPIRAHGPTDAVGWYALYSLIINVVMISTIIAVAVYRFDFEPKELFATDWRTYLSNRVKNDPLAVAGLALGYPVGSIILALVLGYIVARMTTAITPVWWLETVQRTTKWGIVRRKGHCALSVRVNLNNGGIFFGTLQSVPKDYEVLVAKEKDFSITRALYVPPTGDPVPLDPGEVVLLNTKDVFSIQTIEEPLDREEAAKPSPLPTVSPAEPPAATADEPPKAS